MENNNIRILVADDEQILSFFLRQSLEEDPGYEVEVSNSGSEALSKVTRARYDLIIADLRMPGLDGLQLIKAARAFNGDIKAILMTAFGSESAEAEAQRIGIDGYICKPFAMEELKRLVRQATRPNGAQG